MTDRHYLPAAVLALVTALLHPLALFSGQHMVWPLLMAGLLWLGLAATLFLRWRGWAYAAYLIGLGTGLIALWFALTAQWPGAAVWWGIVAAAWLCALSLLRVLWFPRPRVRPRPAARRRPLEDTPRRRA